MKLVENPKPLNSHNDNPLSAVEQCSPAVCVIHGREQQLVPFQTALEGTIGFSFFAHTEYQEFSVIADASDFDWSELYLELNCYGNSACLTGPWDFNLLDGNKPLVPSYWVELNGLRLGLWYFQRVSLEDLASRHFRGRMAFRAKPNSTNRLKLIPFRAFNITWIQAILQEDPTFLKPPLALSHSGFHKIDWAAIKISLETSHAPYSRLLNEALAWLEEHNSLSFEELELLVGCYCLNPTKRGLASIVKVIDNLLMQSAWGNPTEGGYGHNGDLGAALTIRAMAWAWHNIREQLGEARQQRILEKLAYHGDCFIKQALLSQDYWGGSLLQDHGWRSMFRFGAATLFLKDVIPEAEDWWRWIFLRIEQAMEAAPKDGAIPMSSYGSPDLYLNDLAIYRDALFRASGECCYTRHPSLGKVVDYIASMLDGGRDQFVDSGLQIAWIAGGFVFLNGIAAAGVNTKAAEVSCRLLERVTPKFNLPSLYANYYSGAFHACLNYVQKGSNTEHGFHIESSLLHFEDSGLAYYNDKSTNIALAVRCGPAFGYNAYRKATGPCDRVGRVPGAGHFSLFIDTTERLITPESGYRMRSFQYSCLLVGGEGQKGDIGYPMSIPSFSHYGEEISHVAWCETSGQGFIRINLKPAYPEAAEILDYTRTFILRRGEPIICRDQVLLDSPKELSWLFQIDGTQQVDLIPGGALVANDLKLKAEATTTPLEVCLRTTDIVWSYSSPSFRNPVSHIRFTSKHTRQAVVSFVLQNIANKNN